MPLVDQFTAAVATSRTLSEKPDNSTLLTLYSLYKQATEGNSSDEFGGGPYDFVDKFKYDAWARLKGTTKDAAMQQYIDLVAKLKG
ncbi:MAG: acyl-CoA-binding protein [Flavobacterium sp.]|nr:acyl-CoA-binding protein [Flavobacterium sp.]